MPALRIRPVLLVALLVVSGSVAAVPSPRNRPSDTAPPVRVFVGETLDVSAVELTGGGTIGTGSVELVGVAGDADGTVETIADPTDADLGGFETGTYRVSTDGDDGVEFAVAEPRVTKVVVRNQNGANVTNAWEPDGESLTVTAEYNFAEADRLDLTVEDSDGVDVTREVASGDRITTSGGSVQLDLSDQQEGTFRITLEGSDLDRASRTVTVRTGPRRTATPLPSPTTPAGTPTPSPTPTDVGTESPTETPTPTEQPTETGASPGTPTEAAGTEQPTETPTPTATETSGPGFGPLAAVLAVVALAGYALRRRSR